MANNKGARRGKLADMSTAPKVYRPPSCPPAVEENDRIHLTETARLAIRTVMYHKLVVDFAIMQLTLDDGEWKHVARIDCDGGVIHRHQFDQAGNNLDGHLEIKTIPADSDERRSIVQAGYFEALGVMQAEWEDNLRRWRDGR